MSARIYPPHKSFGRYIEPWEAQAVARALRAEGYRRVGVKKLSNYNYTVLYEEKR